MRVYKVIIRNAVDAEEMELNRVVRSNLPMSITDLCSCTKAVA